MKFVRWHRRTKALRLIRLSGEMMSTGGNMIPTPEDIVKIASKAAFDKPLVMNVQRAAQSPLRS